MARMLRLLAAGAILSAAMAATAGSPTQAAINGVKAGLLPAAGAGAALMAQEVPAPKRKGLPANLWVV